MLSRTNFRCNTPMMTCRKWQTSQLALAPLGKVAWMGGYNYAAGACVLADRGRMHAINIGNPEPSSASAVCACGQGPTAAMGQWRYTGHTKGHVYHPRSTGPPEVVRTEVRRWMVARPLLRRTAQVDGGSASPAAAPCWGGLGGARCARVLGHHSRCGPSLRARIAP